MTEPIDWENGPFKAEDFALPSGYEERCTRANAAAAANARFKELLEQCETVFGFIDETAPHKIQGMWTHWCRQKECKLKPDTHSAKLIVIKEIK